MFFSQTYEFPSDQRKIVGVLLLTYPTLCLYQDRVGGHSGENRSPAQQIQVRLPLARNYLAQTRALEK